MAVPSMRRWVTNALALSLTILRQRDDDDEFVVVSPTTNREHSGDFHNSLVGLPALKQSRTPSLICRDVELYAGFAKEGRGTIEDFTVVAHCVDTTDTSHRGLEYEIPAGETWLPKATLDTKWCRGGTERSSRLTRESARRCSRTGCGKRPAQ